MRLDNNVEVVLFFYLSNLINENIFQHHQQTEKKEKKDQKNSRLLYLQNISLQSDNVLKNETITKRKKMRKITTSRYGGTIFDTKSPKSFPL